jgi:hypothetical protein
MRIDKPREGIHEFLRVLVLTVALMVLLGLLAVLAISLLLGEFEGGVPLLVGLPIH